MTESNPTHHPQGHASSDGAAAAHAAEENRLLRALPLQDYERLLMELRPTRLDAGQVLVEANVPITNVWFPRTGVGSMLAAEQEGGTVEVGTIGQEGFIGLPVLLGVDQSPYRNLVQVPGDGWRMSADAFRRIVDERPAVRRHFMRYVQYFHDQMAQAVACNRLHTIEERCARWLLMTHDRVNGDEFQLTQEFLAMMLGVRRAGVSVTMGVLQRSGIVTYTRGRVTVLDRARLEEASCGCYRITRDAMQQLGLT